VPRSFSPKAAMRAFDAKPGVVRTVVYDDSPANNGTIAVPPL